MEKPGLQHIIGLYGSARAWCVANLLRERGRLLVVCPDVRSMEELGRDLGFFLGAEQVRLYRPWDTLPFEPVSPQPIVTAERLRVLTTLSSNESRVVVTSVDAIRQKVLPPRFVNSRAFTVTRDTTWDRTELAQRLRLCGFHESSTVEAVGEIAVRGNTIDFAPTDSVRGIRLEFFGDVVEKIKVFDLDTQRSIASLPEFSIYPLREYIPWQLLNSKEHATAMKSLRERAAECEVTPATLNFLSEAVASSTPLPGIELLQPLLCHSSLLPFFSYLPSDETIVLVEADHIRTENETLTAKLNERHERLLNDQHLLPTVEELFLSEDDVSESLTARASVYLQSLPSPDFSPGGERNIINIRSHSNKDIAVRVRASAARGELSQVLATEIVQLRERGMKVGLVVGSEERARRLQRLLGEGNLHAELLGSDRTPWLQGKRKAPVVILIGQISHGAQLPEHGIALLAETELFAERSYRRSGERAVSMRRVLSTLRQLRAGDYLVHRHYGIGIYRGLKHLTIEGAESDFLQIEYSDSTLYLPVTNISTIQKFSAGEGQVPRVDKLGSQRWIRTTQKVRESIASLAGDLIRLYATRTVVPGWRFEPIGAEDERFADGFPFQETPDQLSAIEATLTDMSSDKPMDRLVCGDVGFGKTEVALRAAYKATQHYKQVAVLAPTTILVEQHLQTFRDRFAEYPVKVAAVSRFYTSQKNRETLAKVASGDVDIVLGTHRLIQRDVTFRDLGLLIIDEEHRFGVQQKERLKQMKRQLDVLTLTATPIPRTLHMALLDVRDISVISTPPTDRQVTRTYVSAFDHSLIRDAILRELQRGGQVYYLHNKVESIRGVTEQLRLLIPEARFDFGHGQMSDHDLEAIMMKFYHHEIDVLVCTTIVESGLDVSNANTILIESADKFGLAQLYQLRGRVGRSSRQAYAYLLVPERRQVSHSAMKRLEVLQALDDLGIGFQLAVRDLEIRGAGNLLGREQSGSVLSVGFELYSRILKEAVLQLKGEELPIEEEVDPEVKLGFRAYIPETYIPDISERLVLYQRLAAIASDEEAIALHEEIQDRFGPPGVELMDFLEIMRFRGHLRRYGITHAEWSDGKLSLSFSPRAPVNVDQILALVREQPQTFRFSKTHTLTARWPDLHVETPADITKPALTLLRGITSPARRPIEQMTAPH